MCRKAFNVDDWKLALASVLVIELNWKIAFRGEADKIQAFYASLWALETVHSLAAHKKLSIQIHLLTFLDHVFQSITLTFVISIL